MIGSTVGSLLRNSAAMFPSLEAIVDDGRRITFAELDGKADDFARGLISIGVSRGDHVGIWLTTCPEWIVAFCACARIGAVVVPVNTRYQTQEVEFILVQADIKILITQQKVGPSNTYDMLLAISPELEHQTPGSLSTAKLPKLRSIVMIDTDKRQHGALSYVGLLDTTLSRDALSVAENSVEESDALVICFTSGSTGKPKGVVHSHRTIHHSRRIAEVLHYEAGDRLLLNWPLSHVAGLFIALVPALASAATLVLMPNWDGSQALSMIESEKITVIGGISTHFIDLVDAINHRDADTSSLKVAYVGGATIARDTFANIVEKLKLPRLLSTYGMTENTVSTTFNDWDDPFEVCRQNKAPVITRGPVKVVDTKTLDELPIGEEGEIWCAGPTLMLGYYKQPKATKAVLTEDGWLRTGDLGRFDNDGFLQITGRLKDIVKVGGVNVAPADVEECLMSNPAVKFAVVVGVPDERLGEVCHAFVQLNADQPTTENELIEFCRTSIARYKVPKYVKFVEEFPRLSTGKIQRPLLVEEAAKNALTMSRTRSSAPNS